MDDDTIADQEEYRQLIHMNRNVLVGMLVTLNEPYEYDADKQRLAYLIQARRRRGSDSFREKVPSSSRDFQYYYQFSFLLSLICLIALVLIDIGLCWIPSRPHFCDTTNATEPCTRCPTLATCARGIAMCAENHTLVRSLCVPRDGNEFLVAEGVEFLLDRLRIQAGNHRCDLVDTDSMTRDLVEQEITKHWKEKNRHAIPKVITRLSIEPTIQISIIGGQEFFTAEDFRKPFRCEAKLMPVRRLPVLTVVVIVAAFVGMRCCT
jgi:hypothetical protein